MKKMEKAWIQYKVEPLKEPWKHRTPHFLTCKKNSLFKPLVLSLAINLLLAARNIPN